MVTWPWVRQSFSLPQYSVQYPLPLPSTYSPLFPLQNMLPADICSLEENGPSCGLSFKLFHSHFSSWIAALASNSKIYVICFFSFFPVEVSKQSEFQRNKKTTSLAIIFSFFFFFSLEKQIYKRNVQVKRHTPSYTFLRTFQKHEENLCR